MQEEVSWLFKMQRYGVSLGLETMQRLLDALGNPEKKISVLHIAGTNGKGSVSAITESILRAAGYRTGLYTSPHLVDFKERIRINGLPIEETALKKGIQKLKAVTQGWEQLPTFFELTTALAFDYFAQQQCEILVLETGMGGRLDATNLAAQKIACAITPIGLDHQAFLGETLALIAKEKAGIIRPGVPVVSAPQCLEAATVLQEEAFRIGAPLHFVVAPLAEDAPLGLLGSHQRWNAALAVALVRHFSPSSAVVNGDVDLLAPARSPLTGLPTAVYPAASQPPAFIHSNSESRARLTVSQQAIQEGLATVSWPGRFQPFLIKKQNGKAIPEVDNLLILDGAHNQAGVQQLVATWKELFQEERCTLIFGALRDKEWEKMLPVLKTIASTIIFVPVASPRTALVHELLLQESEAITFSSLQQALEIVAPKKEVFPFFPHEMRHFFDFIKKRKKNLLSKTPLHAPVLVVGSLFLIGEALALLEEKQYHPCMQ
ncbi:MAG: bifunctional folylpolyglutamate synthase/dihydrofolate synthase [Chthoniobacterales bacterium]|nr:bifunctional folylpolyglutamate synthase/dihydrofolate synthase [Chthoniobacterales bacterium]